MLGTRVQYIIQVRQCSTLYRYCSAVHCAGTPVHYIVLTPQYSTLYRYLSTVNCTGTAVQFKELYRVEPREKNGAGAWI